MGSFHGLEDPFGGRERRDDGKEDEWEKRGSGETEKRDDGRRRTEDGNEEERGETGKPRRQR